MKPAVDLVIVDFPDGLHVPGISLAANEVPPWNETVQDFIRYTVGFCGGYLHDDGALLIFYPDSVNVGKEISKYFKKNRLTLKREWTIINSLHLAHPLDPSEYVSHLLIFDSS